MFSNTHNEICWNNLIALRTWDSFYYENGKKMLHLCIFHPLKPVNRFRFFFFTFQWKKTKSFYYLMPIIGLLITLTHEKYVLLYDSASKWTSRYDESQKLATFDSKRFHIKCQKWFHILY